MFDDNIFNTNQRPIEITEEQAKAARIERFGYDPENPQEAPEGPMPQPKVLPGTGYEPGMFEGAWEAPFKGLGAAALGSASTALSLVGEVAPGDTFRSYAKDLRKLNRKWFEPDPEEMGQVGQIIRSLFEYVPKFAIYTAATGNPVTGAAAFGVDTGAGEYYRLRDEGVKTSTALQAGAVTGVGNMLGGIIPAAVGTSRAMSAIYGAATNVALDAGERAAVRTILENDNYQKIANRYETSWSDVALSAGMGGFFGAIAWRNPEQIQRQLREDQINRRADAIASFVTKKLKATGQFPDDEIKVQVAPNARSAAALLENAGKSDDEIAEIVYREMAQSGGDELRMPETQGKHWDMGPTIGAKDTQIEIHQFVGDTASKEDAVSGNESAKNALRRIFGIVKGENGGRPTKSVYVDDLGFKVTMGNNDIKKIFNAKRNAWLMRSIANNFEDLIKTSMVVERAVDTKHDANQSKGIHKLINALEVTTEYSDGGARTKRTQRLRMIVTVVDYDHDGGGAPTIHNIGNWDYQKEIKEITFEELTPTAQTVTSGAATEVAREGLPEDLIRTGSKSDKEAPLTVMLSDLMGGETPYERADKKGYFDPVDPAAYRDKNGVYYQADERQTAYVGIPESDDLNQRGVEGTQRADGQGAAGKSGSSAGGSDELAQIAYHGTPYVFDRFTLDHIGSGEGAQAHGWGLYFALDKKVADGYRERLTGDTKEGFVEKKLVRFGKKLKDALSSNRVSLGDIQTLYSKIASDSLPNVIEDMPGINGRRAEDIKARLGNPSREEARRLARVLDFVNDEIENRNTYDDFMENLESIKPEVRDYVKQTVLNGETWESTKGRLYSVDIPEDNVMLREDAKLEDQPDGVQMAVHNLLDGWYEKFTGEPFPGTRRGYEILAILEENLGGPKAAAMALKNEGVLGLRYEGGRDGECAVVWSEDAIGIRDALEQRLSSHIAGSYSAKLNRIILTALADLSTFSHEHAHWYMTKLLAYAGEEGMSSEIVQDALRLLNAMGIKSLDDWNAMSFEQQRVYHERFGAWVEIYLSKGRSPIRSLDDVFKRFGEWLVDMYRNKFGKTAEEHVGDRYKSEFDDDLPPLSDEVMAALDRMYGADAKARTVIPSVAQTVAARIAQAERANTDKVTSPMKDRNSDATYRAAKAAQIDARDQMNEGQKVDVSSSVREDDANADMVSSGTKTFARTAQMGGENDTIVVLQNRDRSTVASQSQMNSIAADPQYGKLSFSRTTDSGAPIVSYGSLPADEFVGNTDYVSDGGKRIPVTYAVVEADSIMTSNTWDGRQNEAYGSDPETIHAVAGNGRVAGLQEAYNRGTTDAYVQEMQADTTHGVSPEAIGKLQNPVLVRFVGRENVTTGFVDRSNQSAVLDLSGKERAVKDAGKLTSSRMRGYTFDEDGNPTRDTLERFVNDIGEPSSLGALIDDNGLPTDRARDRIRAAVFYAAYRDEELTALVVDSSDKQGIKRILNAMSAFAPNVIAIREASNGAIDIGPVIVEAVNRIRSGRLIGEGDMFEETNPAVDQVFNILSQNRNSAAAIGRVFNDFMDRIEAALGGGTDALFGDAPDLAMAMQYLRAAENAQGQRLLELGKEFAPLPDIDVESVRATLAAIQEAAPNAEKVAVAMGEKVLEDAGAATKAEPAVETQTIDPRDPARAGAVFTESADVERLRNLFAEDPEAAYVVEGPDGVAREMTAQDILDMERQYAEQGQTDAVGIGKATECILRNGGIKE